MGAEVFWTIHGKRRLEIQDATVLDVTDHRQGWRGEITVTSAEEMEFSGLTRAVKRRLIVENHPWYGPFPHEIAQCGAETGEPLRAARFNKDGTVDLTYPPRLAGEKISCGDHLRLDPDGLTVWKYPKRTGSYQVVKGYEMLKPATDDFFRDDEFEPRAWVTTVHEGQHETIKGWKWDRERGPHRVEDKPADPFPAKIGRINKLPRF